MSLPVVAIVGRPNVGKSSLFNRFLKKKLAVVDAEAGVTRDRNYAICDWNGREFRLIDTGGMVPNTRDAMERAILDQSDFAINESDLVLLIVDVQVGLDHTDERLARLLMKSGKNCILIANKVDDSSMEWELYSLNRLGLGDALPISATVGLGVGDVLDEIVARLPEAVEEIDDGETIRVALVGRPNVGKSSFINRLLGEQRLIVSDQAGTTRDAVDTPFELDGKSYVLVDTAGLRRRYKVQENIEFYTNLRADRAIDACHVAVVLVDAVDGFTSQDQRVLAQVMETRRPAVLAINKWDLIEKDTYTADKFSEEIKESLAKYAFVPLIYISALTGKRLAKVMELVQLVHAEHNKRIPTSQLNDLLQKAFGRRKPPAKQGKYIQFNYVTQTEVAPPTFIFFSNRPQMVDKSYLNYLANQLRAEFGFHGSPIRLKCRRK
ncbi:MAG: ribosome biogenesis GTPase Der [candidate division Zixibacteria bacterium]|nr:ribosome biogenesis GTPase Der [candidate division Zixibacteria bacterium]